VRPQSFAATPILEVDQEWDQTDEHGNPVPDVSALSSWATQTPPLAPLQKSHIQLQTPDQTCLPVNLWQCVISFLLYTVEWQQRQKGRRGQILMNERNSLHLVSTLCLDVLVMLVNEFVLSTEIVVQKCRAKYFCTAFTRGYQNHSNFAPSRMYVPYDALRESQSSPSRCRRCTIVSHAHTKLSHSLRILSAALKKAW
jgi:hypothetical protein